MRRVWAPDWYCASTRPVVRCTGKSGHTGSAVPRCVTGWKRARPSAWANRSRNIRGVPADPVGQGQNTPPSSAIAS